MRRTFPPRTRNVTYYVCMSAIRIYARESTGELSRQLVSAHIETARLRLDTHAIPPTNTSSHQCSPHSVSASLWS